MLRRKSPRCASARRHQEHKALQHDGRGDGALGPRRLVCPTSCSASAPAANNRDADSHVARNTLGLTSSVIKCAVCVQEQQQQRMLAEARERSLNASLATLPSADLGAALGLPMSATAATGVAGATLGDVAAQHSADMLDAMAQAQAGPGAGLQQAAMHEEAGAAVAAEAGADVAGVGPPQLAGTAPTQDG